jgi:uncharacterized membrane protein
MRTLTYYFSNLTGESDNISPLVKNLCAKYQIPFVDICIDGNPDLEERYSGKTPSVLIGPYRLNYPFEIIELEVAIRATQGMEQIPIEPESTNKRSDGLDFSRLESFSLWFSRSYVWVISSFLVIFVAIAFLAPVFELTGNKKLASGIYKVYSILCHQLAFRSFFIGGEQVVYPRELANLQGLVTYEQVTGYPAEDIDFARNLPGNSLMGYKVALCERDISIYLSLALFGPIFQITGKKIKGLPWYLWFLLGLLPIAVDGFSQLPGLAQGWPSWMLARESTPFLRVLTGLLFGGGTAWYIYPLMEESMQAIRINLSRKLMIINKVKKQAVS